jgi:hypothetical protein
MKETAVEWLLENLNSEPYSEKEFNYNKECWDKAKEIEMQQIIKAAASAYEDMFGTDGTKYGEKYYDKLTQEL